MIKFIETHNELVDYDGLRCERNVVLYNTTDLDCNHEKHLEIDTSNTGVLKSMKLKNKKNIYYSKFYVIYIKI